MKRNAVFFSKLFRIAAFVSVTALILPGSVSSACAQITGANPVATGSTHTYTYTGPPPLYTPTWTIIGGTKVSSTTTTVTVQWGNTPTNGTIRYTHKTTLIDTKSVLISSPPPAPSTSNVSRCGPGSLTLTATGAQAGQIYKWYTSSSGGTLLHTGSTYEVSLNTTTSYWVGLENEVGIEGPRDQATANILSVPSPPQTVSSSYSNCGPAAFTLVPNVAPGEESSWTYKWYAPNGSLAATTSGAYTTPTLSSSVNYSFSRTIVTGVCESPKRTVPIYVHPVPTTMPSAADVSRCGAGPVTLTASGGSSYRWFNAQGTLLGSSASYTTPSISSTTNYYVELVNANGCGGPRKEVKAIINSVPALPNANSQSLCGGGQFTFTATGSSGSYRWYNASNALVSSSATFQPTTYTDATYSVEAISSAGCLSSRRYVTADVLPRPLSPSVTVLADIPGGCEPSSFELEMAQTTGYTYKWFINTPSGTPVSTQPFYPTPLLASTTTYYAIRNDGTCDSAPEPVLLEFNEPSTLIAGGSDVARYGGGQVTLTATNGPNGYKWYNALQGGTQVGTGSSISVSPSASTPYFVTALSAAGCTGQRTQIDAIILPTQGVNVQYSGSPVIPANGSRTLSVSGTHDAYQWIRNGTDIPGATGATYPATLKGNYKARLTPGGNTAGSFTTGETTLAEPTSMIMGANYSFEDHTEKYFYTLAGSTFHVPLWTVTNGEAIETDLSADARTASVTVRWTQHGTGLLALKDAGTFIDSRGVLVTANCAGSSVPAIPTGQKHFFQESGTSVTITLAAAAGEVIQWMDTDLLMPTISHEGNQLTLTNVTHPYTYKVRAYNPVTHCASPVAQVQVNTFEPIPAQYVRNDLVRVDGITATDQLPALTSTQKAVSYSYMDGFGRVTQQVMQKASPLGFDIVQPVEYDQHGRVTKSFLPYVSGTTDGAHQSSYENDQLNFYNNAADKVADDAAPFATSIFEASPLGRIREAGSVGAAWQPGTGHTNRVSYTFNEANEVRNFNPNGSSTGFYAAKKLSKTTGIDADGNQTITYNDLTGRTLLTKQQLDETIDGANVPFLETYYIYDNAGRISYIVPPKAVSMLGGNGWWFTQTVIDQCYQFIYDTEGRLVEKKVPGQDWFYYAYDRLRRPVLVQDGHLRAENKWMFIKYDRKQRTVMQGIYKNTTQTTRSAIQVLLDDLYKPGNAQYPEGTHFDKRGTTLHGYTNVSFPKLNADGSAIEPWSVLYYDNYDFDMNGSADYAYVPQGLAGEGQQGASAGMVTGSKRIIIGTSNWLINYVFYDHDRRPIQIRSNNHKNLAVDNLQTVVYDFEGKTLLAKTYHRAGTGNTTTVLNRFVYDTQGRLLKVYQTNNATAEQLVVQHEYNELGQIVDKKLHNTSGAQFLQSVDLRYNIRGWLTSINNAKLETNSTNNPDTDVTRDDFFGMELVYNGVESGLANTPRFNGNMSAMKWKGIGAETGSEDQSSYKFVYDKSNKLKSATSQMFNGTAWTKEAGALNESMTYDHNGNILGLQRSHRRHELNGLIASYVPETMDQLTYTYTTEFKDRLLKVTDGASNPVDGFSNGTSGTDNDYTYDDQGNITADKNKGIDSLHYNYLGKVRRIKFADGRVISYTYDAAGAKLTMKVCDGSTCTTTDYVGGFVYQDNVLSFFSSPGGRVVNKNNNLEYQYSIADQQGNTRVVFSSATDLVDEYIATFEDAVADETDFDNVPQNSPHWATFFTANHTPGGGKVIRMNQNLPIAASKSLKVFPGDKIDIEVWTYFENNSGFGTSSPGMSTLIGLVAGAFGGVNAGAGEAGAIYNGVDEALSGFGVGGNNGDTNPAAYLNYILFDENYHVLDMGWQAATGLNSQAKISFPTKDITEEGYLFVYLSYENESNNYVQFDDLKITHTKTNVIQYNEYYPFGLQTSKSWTRESDSNNFLHNGGAEINSTTGYYDLFYRNYDPTIGRFMQVDPLSANQMATYQYSGNNPVMLNDPLGDRYDWKKTQAETSASASFREGVNIGGGGGSWAYMTEPDAGLSDYYSNFRNLESTGGGSQVLYGDDGEVIGVSFTGAAAWAAAELIQNGSDAIYATGELVISGHDFVLPGDANVAFGAEVWVDAATGDPGEGDVIRGYNLVSEVEIAFTRTGVGQSGTWESIIPVWGSGRNAYDDWHYGDYGHATWNTVLAASDLFLIRAAAGAIVKGAGKVAAKTSTSLVAKYPANAAITGTTERVFLRPGQVIDRYGSLSGKWFSQPGVSYGSRSIPPGQAPYMQFRVLKPFEVNSSLASPGMLSGQTGFGIQFQSPVGANILIKRGIIAPF